MGPLGMVVRWGDRAGQAVDTILPPPQLVGSMFQVGDGQDRATLASRFQRSLGDLLAQLGR